MRIGITLIVLFIVGFVGTTIIGCGGSHSSGVYCPWGGSQRYVTITDDQMYDFDIAAIATSSSADNNIIRLYYDTNSDKWVMYWGTDIDIAYASTMQIAKSNQIDPVHACPQTQDYSAYRGNDSRTLDFACAVFFVKTTSGDVIKMYVDSWGGSLSSHYIRFCWEQHTAH